MIFFFRATALALAASFVSSPLGNAVTFLSTSDPAFNTTAPGVGLAGSGWQFEGLFGSFLATAIGPHHFVTAKHVGGASNVVIYRGVSYPIIGWQDDPGSDLRILEVSGTVPEFAALYGFNDEAGRDFVVFGRGAQRGESVYSSGSLVGWKWGAADGVERWGENHFAETMGSLLYATFDQNAGPNEADLSSGDSGGAAFINDGQVWRLAGINYGVDGPFAFTPGAPVFEATLFDTRGVFNSTTGQVATGSRAVSSGFYLTRISARLGWIRTVIAPALASIAAQGPVGKGNDTVKVSFTIAGPAGQTKRVLIRGLGPSLPVAGRLADPSIELRNGGNIVIASNDNWTGTSAVKNKKKKKKKKSGAATAPTQVQITGLAPANSQESALMTTLSPGRYTALLHGAANTTGIGSVEVYDVDPAMGPMLQALSASGAVTANSALIVKVTVDSDSGRFLMRGAGPDLAASGVSHPLGDPVMDLEDVYGSLLASNDNWRSAPNSNEIFNTGLAPADDHDCAILAAAASGGYTIVIRGNSGATGTAVFQADLLP